MLTPKFSKSVISLLISIISGILLIITFGVKRTAHKICKASFFAPCGVISPLDGCPSILKFHMVVVRFI
jgi:hypothetical protein